MTRKLLGGFVVVMALLMGMERFLQPAAAVEVDMLIVSCNEAWFSGQLDTDADEVRLMISRASDGKVLVTQTFPVVQKQYANHIFYPEQPEGTVLTLSFGEWEFAYLQTPVVTDVACDDSQENKANQAFATVTRGPTLTPSQTHTPLPHMSPTPDLTATHYYWLVVTYGPQIMTRQPYRTPMPATATQTPSLYRTPMMPSNTPHPTQLVPWTVTPKQP